MEGFGNQNSYPVGSRSDSIDNSALHSNKRPLNTLTQDGPSSKKFKPSTNHLLTNTDSYPVGNKVCDQSRSQPPWKNDMHLQSRGTSNRFTGNVRGAILIEPHFLKPRIGSQKENLGSYSKKTTRDELTITETKDEEADIDDLRHADTYDEYKPLKLHIGKPHPDAVVESSSLHSVQPPDVHYNLHIPKEIYNQRKLSNLQLESIVYASQQHENILPNGQRAGFLIGDGAGIGKGRSISGIIYENYLQGRKKSIWFSISNDLKYDAERDLKDIGAEYISVYSLNNFKYNSISSEVDNGVIFVTYSALVGESMSGGRKRTRLQQLLDWCGNDFDGLIVFDECHKAKNLCPGGTKVPTKTGLNVLELQDRLPNARIVYASATGASELKDMAYMTRLGLWGRGTDFPTFKEFNQAIEKRGVGSMELIAMEMKQKGIYLARQLSFKGVSFQIKEIALDTSFVNLYNEAVKLWVDSKTKFQIAASLLGLSSKRKMVMWAQFWATHQRFFKYMCNAAKVDYTVRYTQEAIERGHCVVIGLQSTGEAKTLEGINASGGVLNDFVSTTKGVMQALLENHFPSSHEADKYTDSEISSTKLKEARKTDNYNKQQMCIDLKNELLIRLEKFGEKLPPNTLDELISKLGGPTKVAEMTGRKGRVVCSETGTVRYESRSNNNTALEMLNIAEKQMFMDGTKRIAIISEAASSGISLQADRRAKNKARRIHITLELPWSADRAIQQFGRTHRSNQVSAPEYLFLISELAGEKRFASAVAKRIESMGALTHGDRRAGECRDLSMYNVDNKYGRSALKSVGDSLNKLIKPLVPPPTDYNGNFFCDIKTSLIGVGLATRDFSGNIIVEEQFLSINTFLNRILGLEVNLQNRLYNYFSDTMDIIIQQAIKSGNYDSGILDLGHGKESVKSSNCKRFCSRHSQGTPNIELHTIKVERGLTWNQSLEIQSEVEDNVEGFYVSKEKQNDKHTAILAINGSKKKSRDHQQQFYIIYKPHTGMQSKQSVLTDITETYKKVNPEDAQMFWEEQHGTSLSTCTHIYYHGACNKVKNTKTLCDVGLRNRNYHVLSGAVLSIWKDLERFQGSKLQIVRFKTDQNITKSGILIPALHLAQMENYLAKAFKRMGTA